MATKTRSSGGCWTCRLRRKKCDEAHPLCSNCAALEIDCLYGDEKPEWMDGAEKQRQRAEWLKHEVKRKAAHRRERRYLQGLEVRLESLDVSPDHDSDVPATRGFINTAPPSASKTDSSPAYDDPRDSTPRSGPSSVDTDSSLSLPTPDEPSDGYSRPDLQTTLSQEVDSHMTMLYLDYVFPFLFPFYRPSLLDVGRAWLLVLLTKNKALFHAALSLAGYFYATVLGHIREAPGACQTHNLQALQRQQGLALQWLQREMQDIIVQGVKGNLAEANRVMASIIQLMTCEVAIAKPGNWTMHLEAAAQLFNEIMKHHAFDQDGRGPCFMLVLLQLGPKPFKWTPKNYPWGSDQAILRFFTAQLLFLDTLASTALDTPPRLQQWHQPLLSEPDEDTKKMMPVTEKETTLPHINLQEFVGVQNWVILSIGEIAALESWKKERKKAGALSVAQLVTRGAAIEERLRASLQVLGEPEVKHCGQTSMDEPQNLLQYFSAGFLSPRMMHGTDLNTRIWAQAAFTYLAVVLSGWQPSSLEIRASVARTIELLLSLPSPDCLRTLVWPFTVTGCLATADQEQIFRDMVTAMGPLKQFGTIGDGLAILETVWARRAEIDENPDQWDLAACFSCLGRPALLL
ncbi:hypothetical protein VTK56DRAFT_6958 [Thermocarpiscus australiensis]